MASTVRLIHWNQDEGLERRRQLEAFGFETAFECGDSLSAARLVKASPPDAVVIDLSRLPSAGREVAQSLRSVKATRHLPIVFVGGEPEKVARTRQLLPDATYTTWGRIRHALTKAITHPVTNPIVPDHRVWGTPLTTKLGIKPGFKVALLAAPRGFADTLIPLPANVTFTARPAGADLFLCFARKQPELQAHLLALRHAERQTAWLIWPKKAAKVESDLDGNVVRETGLAAGWVDFKVCSVDDTWSGLAFKRRR
ncbi:MAG TPA: response regulator [Vicinamibacterales bacterium]|nr:response regulator [Vicinamibacterales bacterium]